MMGWPNLRVLPGSFLSPFPIIGFIELLKLGLSGFWWNKNLLNFLFQFLKHNWPALLLTIKAGCFLLLVWGGLGLKPAASVRSHCCQGQEVTGTAGVLSHALPPVQLVPIFPCTSQLVPLWVSSLVQLVPSLWSGLGRSSLDFIPSVATSRFSASCYSYTSILFS